jgi:hypothetical protein
MVLKLNIGRVIRWTTFFLLVLLFSCEEIKTAVINCSKCTTEEPESAEVELKLNPDGYNNILVTIYEGNVEDSIKRISFWTSNNSTSCTLPLNKKFSFVARYYSSDRNYYYCINSTTVHVKYIEDQCDDPCYVIYDNIVNLRLFHH